MYYIRFSYPLGNTGSADVRTNHLKQPVSTPLPLVLHRAEERVMADR